MLLDTIPQVILTLYFNSEYIAGFGIVSFDVAVSSAEAMPGEALLTIQFGSVDGII